jgi:hypothetical protein
VERRCLEERRRIVVGHGTYDPALNLTYWGLGNPGPDFNAGAAAGDNLYTDSVVALNADTGKLQWHFQFTPNDRTTGIRRRCRCWSMQLEGAPAKLLMLANRNGFFYVLDRDVGKFLFGKPFIKVNWASGLDSNGRPIQTPQPPGATTWPGSKGGPAGTRRHTVRVPDCSTFQPGKTCRACSRVNRLNTSPVRITGAEVSDVTACARRTVGAEHQARPHQQLDHEPSHGAVVAARSASPANGSGRSRCTTSPTPES